MVEVNYYWFLVCAFVVIVVILDILLRRRKVKQAKVRLFELLCISLILIFVLLTSQNTGVIALMGTSLVSFAWIFKDTLCNLGSTVLLHLYPQYEHNDVLNVSTNVGMPQKLRYVKLGFLRSKLVKPNGDIVYIPNSTLLNDVVAVA